MRGAGRMLGSPRAFAGAVATAAAAGPGKQGGR